jgi:hypothetical protein
LLEGTDGLSRLKNLSDNNRFESRSVADSDPESGAFLTPGSWIRDGKKSGSGSGMNIPIYISESLERILWVRNT